MPMQYSWISHNVRNSASGLLPTSISLEWRLRTSSYAEHEDSSRGRSQRRMLPLHMRKVCRLGKVEWDLRKSGIAESRARLNYQTGKRRCRAVTLISNKNGAKRPSDRHHTVTRWSHASSRVLHLPLGSTFYICVWFPAQLLLLSTNLFSISVKIKAQSVSIVTPETESAPIPLEGRYLFNKETWVRRK